MDGMVGGRLDPDGHVDGEVEDQAQKPVGNRHGALAGRHVGE